MRGKIKNLLCPSTWTERVLTGMIFLQIVLLCVINLTQLRALVGYDSSSGYLMVHKMTEQGSLILKDWAYQTTMGWDSPVLGAAFFNMFLHDPFLSFGISNILSVAVMVVIFVLLLHEMNIYGTAARLAVVMLLTPYTAAYSATNSLDYFSMTCINMGSYSYRIIFLFALAVCYIRLEKRWNQKMKKSGKAKSSKAPTAKASVSVSTIVLAVLSSALALIIGICTGISMVILLVAPFILASMVRVFFDSDAKVLGSSAFLFALSQAALIFIGKLISSHVLHFSGRAESIEWISAEKFFSNVQGLFSGYFALTFGLPLQSRVNITSKLGIAFGVMLCIALFLAVCGIRGMIRAIRHKDFSSPDFLFTCVILVNAFVLLFSNSSYSSETIEPRYFIYILISFMLLCCQGLSGFTPDPKKLIERVFLPIVILAFAFSNLMFYYSLYHHRVNLQKYDRIIAQVNQTQAPVIYTFGEDVGLDSRILRALDLDHIYHQIASDFSGIEAWGDTTEKMTAETWSGRVCILTTKENFEAMPPYVTGTYTYVTEVEGYVLYCADENVITNAYLASEKEDFFYVVPEKVTEYSESV